MDGLRLMALPDQRAHLAECHAEAAAAVPVVARAVEALCVVERDVQAGDWETIDEFNVAWDTAMAAGAGGLLADLARIARLINDVIPPTGRADHLTSH